MFSFCVINEWTFIKVYQSIFVCISLFAYFLRFQIYKQQSCITVISRDTFCINNCSAYVTYVIGNPFICNLRVFPLISITSHRQRQVASSAKVEPGDKYNERENTFEPWRWGKISVILDMAIKITSVYSDITDKSINQKLTNGEL